MSRKTEKIGRDGDTVEVWSGLNANGEGEPLELLTACGLYAQVIGEPSGAQVALMDRRLRNDFGLCSAPIH